MADVSQRQRLPSPTPVDLGTITIWSAADWTDCYNALSYRSDWPDIARYIVDLGWHPRYAWERLARALAGAP